MRAKLKHMRLVAFIVFLIIITPMEIWLDFSVGLIDPAKADFFWRPFAQAAFYLYAGAIAAELMFRIATLEKHIDVGVSLKMLQLAGLLIITYLIVDYVQLQRPVIVGGGSVENTFDIQIGIALLAVAVSVTAYWLEMRRRRALNDEWLI